MSTKWMATVACFGAVFGAQTTWAAGDKATSKGAGFRRAAEVEVSRLKQRYPRLQVVFRDGQPGPQLVTGLRFVPQGRDARERSAAFMRAYPGLLGGVSRAQLRFVRESRSRARHVALWEHWVDGAPVLGKVLAVTMTEEGVVLRLSHDLVPIAGVPPRRSSAQAATKAAMRSLPGARVSGGVLAGVWVHGGRARPVWRVFLATRQGPFEVDVDAHKGTVLRTVKRLLH